MILESPEKFDTSDTRNSQLQNVEPKHTIIFFVKPNNDARFLRLEGEIETTFEGEPGKQKLFEPGTGTGQYQIGTTNLFYADTRNRRAQITTVDIER
jgi:hypothetical protein